jgi:hypothetical protein
MKKIMVLGSIIMVLSLAGSGLAQPGSGGLRPGPGGEDPAVPMGGGMNPRMYNPQTVATVKGQVEKLHEINMGRRGQHMAIREVILKTDQGNLMVHLGPDWYLDEQKFAIKAGDKLEATGSKITLNNQPYLIAREIKMNNKTLKLRDEQGLPAWRGMGPGPGPGGRQGQKPGGM